MTAKYKRVVIKISGEALAGPSGTGIDNHIVNKVVQQIKVVHDLGIDVGIIIGGGNFWRGRQGVDMDRTTADHMGMLATAINALALQDGFRTAGIDTVVMSAVEMPAYAETFTVRGANEALAAGKLVIFACGLGQPYFSTDTAAVLRAAEIGADAVLMAKNIDGVYNADPRKDPSAVRYDEITYQEVLNKELKALDLSATTFCMENNIRCYAFELKDPNNIYRVVMGEHVGTELHR